MTNTKKGRKANHHTDTVTGKEVTGLTRQKDGRWRIIGTPTKFTEPDEQEAIKKYRRLTAQDVPLSFHAESVFEPVKRKTKGQYNAAEMGEFISLLTDKNDKPFWDRVAKELTERPQYAAKKTGIEKLAWISIEKPEPSPTLASLKDVWNNFAKCSKQQKAKVIRSFDDFITTMEIKILSQITAPLCVAFQDNVHARGLAGKQQQHIFSGVKTLLNFAKKRAVAVKEISAAVDCLRLMQPNESTKTIDPKPISVEDWQKLLAVATGDDKAMILLMLNCAFYAGEVIRVEWDDIKADGTLVTRRKKKGEFIRCATLWPETIEALSTMDRTQGPNIFISSGGAAKGKRLKKDGAFARFRKLVEAAQKKAKEKGETMGDVKASHLRDGSYSAAVAANVTLPLCQLLAGHATGMSDQYVLGNPAMVAPACLAIRTKYFPKS